MRLERLRITNYRCFKDFEHEFLGDSALVVAPNGAGKSSLLEAIAKAYGSSRSVTRQDFRDLTKPLEITAVLSGFAAQDQGVFPDELTFGGTPTLHVGFRATWDHAEEEAEAIYGFPDRGWTRASREQREALEVLWLPAWRDPSRLLQVSGTRSLLDPLIAELPLDDELDQAATAMGAAGDGLAQAQPLVSLLAAGRSHLASFVPDVDPGAFSFGAVATTDRELLRQFALQLTHRTGPIPLPSQSNGLSQLSIFAFVLQVLAAKPSTLLLVDEPELALHPHAQRAVTTSLIDHAQQAVIATHSPSVLDRVDPRRVIRLHEEADGVEPASAGSVADEEATRLARYSTSQTAEAFFARKVILVEGESDRLALVSLAIRLDRDLDAEGISIIALDGGGSIGTFVTLLGPHGLKIPLLGLCDEDYEDTWRAAFAEAGLPAPDHSAPGFFVCDPDLEGELVNALGESAVEATIAKHGHAATYSTFAQQPAHVHKTRSEQLLAFIRKFKVRWIPLLIDELDLTTNVPKPLAEVIANA